MADFENQLRAALRGEAEMQIDPQVKAKIDATYEIIRKKKRNRQRVSRILAAAVVLFVAGFAVAQTGPGAAAFDYIQMKFFSGTVTDKNYVRNENLVAVDQDVVITLERFYTDDLAIGFTLAIDYSKNKKMVEKEHWAEEFWPRMTIQTSEGRNLDEFAMRIDGNLDRENHVMEYYFEMQPKQFAGYANLEEIDISIDKVTGFEEQQPSKPGFYMLDSIETKGNWDFTVNNRNIERLAGKTFLPTTETELPIAAGIAYPSGFAIKITDSKALRAMLHQRVKEGKNNSERLRVEKDGEITYYERDSGYETVENISYTVFAYTGYDEEAKIFLEKEGFEDIELKFSE